MTAAAATTPHWLALRESADAEARASELLDPLRRYLEGAPPLVIRDLGCGTGSMSRWLARRLRGPQHWFLHDRDQALLHLALRSPAGPALDGSPVTAEAEPGDITGLSGADLQGTSLVVGSALLDLLTADEIGHLAGACAAARCPALFALSVTGAVQLTPAEPLDAEIGEAFNDHQRRTHHGRHLLGPDAFTAAVTAFEHRGVPVTTRPSAWRLGPGHTALTAAWLQGWVGAACEQQPELFGAALPYLRRRLAACETGELRVVVAHRDLLALPPEGPR